MKKLPSISPTDLARIAPLDEAQQRNQLSKLKAGHPPFTYRHTRLKLPDILNLQVGGLFAGPKVSWARIEEALISDCASGDETTYNLMAAKALHKFAEGADIAGRLERDGFGGMPLGQGHRVSLWEKAIVRYEGRPHVVFIDLRSTKYLSKDGRRFAFSAQHEQIRERDGDLADAGLLILRVHKPIEGARKVTPHTDAGVELYSYDELNQMTQRTYELWDEIYFKRVTEERRRAAGDDGPLFR
ncbi:MAG: hypothetical protein AAF719_13620 [Pseudomonadota bacterium]